jgi:hypothetical protein
MNVRPAGERADQPPNAPTVPRRAEGLAPRPDATGSQPEANRKQTGSFKTGSRTGKIPARSLKYIPADFRRKRSGSEPEIDKPLGVSPPRLGARPGLPARYVAKRRGHLSHPRPLRSQRPSRVRRRMPSRRCTALSSCPSFAAPQTNNTPTRTNGASNIRSTITMRATFIPSFFPKPPLVLAQ